MYKTTGRHRGGRLRLALPRVGRRGVAQFPNDHPEGGLGRRPVDILYAVQESYGRLTGQHKHTKPGELVPNHYCIYLMSWAQHPLMRNADLGDIWANLG